MAKTKNDKQKRTQVRMDEMGHPAFKHGLKGDIEFEGIPERPGQGEQIKPFEAEKKDKV